MIGNTPFKKERVTLKLTPKRMEDSPKVQADMSQGEKLEKLTPFHNTRMYLLPCIQYFSTEFKEYFN